MQNFQPMLHSQKRERAAFPAMQACARHPRGPALAIRWSACAGNKTRARPLGLPPHCSHLCSTVPICAAAHSLALLARRPSSLALLLRSPHSPSPSEEAFCSLSASQVCNLQTAAVPIPLFSARLLFPLSGSSWFDCIEFGCVGFDCVG
jgi:hypothetical protein